MQKKTIAYAIYAALVLCLAFSLGYLLGYDRGETSIQVTTVVPAGQLADEEEISAESVLQLSENRPINLNTATVMELQQLPGIGPGLAQRIVDYRGEHGKFVSIEQIKDVQGIGEKRYQEMENLITIGETQ